MDKIELIPALLSALKEKAEKATQGKWFECEAYRVFGMNGKNVPAVATDDDIFMVAEPLENAANNAAYIAAANHAVVLALIEKIERLEKENEELRANNYGPEILNDPQAMTTCYFAGRMAEGREKNREMDKLLEENRRLEQENARLKIECHDLDTSGRETAKDLAKLEEEADWLATWCADACAYRRGQCDGCAFNEQSICYCAEPEFATTAEYWRRAAGIASRENGNA